MGFQSTIVFPDDDDSSTIELSLCRARVEHLLNTFKIKIVKKKEDNNLKQKKTMKKLNDSITLQRILKKKKQTKTAGENRSIITK